MSTIIIHVEGNIGAGKSTLMDLLKNDLINKAEFFKEPVKKWQTLNGHNLLELMYKEPKRYGSTFQSYAMLTTLKQIKKFKESTKPLKFFERSLRSMKNCFVEAMKSNEIIDDVTYAVFMEWFKFIEKKFRRRRCCKPDLVIYIKTSPENLLERIKQRGRYEESNMDLGYLTLLHNLHEEWIQKIKNEEKQIIVINGDVSFEEIRNEYNEKIITYLKRNYGQLLQ